MELYRSGLIDDEIAKKLGVNRSTVAAWRSRNNLPPNGGNKIRRDFDKALELYKQGDTDGEIAKKTGNNKATIASWRKRNGLSPNMKIGMKSRIDSETAQKMYKDKASDSDIAKALGMNVSSVRYWRKIHNLPANYDNRGKPREKKEKPKKLPVMVRVVRCKDCKHYHADIGWCDIHSHFIGSEGEACHTWESSDWKMFDEDYYCKDGERRDNDATD